MTSITLPLTYKAIELPAYNANVVRAMLGLHIVEKTITQISDNHLLVKMQAASCNPSDIAFIQGGYNIFKSVPCVPGFEGTGIIAAVGAGLSADHWIGKRVSCFTQEDSDGTWAEYLIIKPGQLIQIDEALTIDQAACFFINPFTAFGLFETAIQRKAQAIVINAAGSRVSDVLFALAKKNHIKTIGIVRRQQTMESLIKKGFDKVLLTSGESFDENLRIVMQEFDSCVVYDAVGGEQTGIIANCLPANSEIVVYGGLSGKPVSGIDSMQLIFKKLTVSGFNLNEWMNNAESAKIEQTKNMLTSMIISEEIKIPINIHISIDEIVKGIRSYLGAMSDGKMLIHF